MYVADGVVMLNFGHHAVTLDLRGVALLGPEGAHVTHPTADLVHTPVAAARLFVDRAKLGDVRQMRTDPRLG